MGSFVSFISISLSSRNLFKQVGRQGKIAFQAFAPKKGRLVQLGDFLKAGMQEN